MWMLRLLSAMMMVGTTDAKVVRSLHSAFYSNAIALLHVIWIQSTNEYSTATIALYKLARSLLIRKLPNCDLSVTTSNYHFISNMSGRGKGGKVCQVSFFGMPTGVNGVRLGTWQRWRETSS
jgi:hypothetical protein